MYLSIGYISSEVFDSETIERAISTAITQNKLMTFCFFFYFTLFVFLLRNVIFFIKQLATQLIENLVRSIFLFDVSSCALGISSVTSAIVSRRDNESFGRRESFFSLSLNARPILFFLSSLTPRCYLDKLLPAVRTLKNYYALTPREGAAACRNHSRYL